MSGPLTVVVGLPAIARFAVSISCRSTRAVPFSSCPMWFALVHAGMLDALRPFATWLEMKSGQRAANGGGHSAQTTAGSHQNHRDESHVNVAGSVRDREGTVVSCQQDLARGKLLRTTVSVPQCLWAPPAAGSLWVVGHLPRRRFMR